MTNEAKIIYYQMEPQPSENIEQTVPDCEPTDSPVLFLDDAETYQLVLQVTPEQWVRLFSAATAGADLLYPDTSLDAVFPLRQAVDCMPTFCEAVNDCIETIPEIKINIISITNYWGEPGEDGENPPVLEINPIIAEDCDYDNLFGACTQMVDLIDQTITDIFERIEAITNSVELANEVLEMIPGFNYLASVLDIANFIQEQLAENYAAEYDSTVRDDLRCALFCRVQPDCVLDFQAMTDVFGGLAGQAIFDIGLEDFIEFFNTGTFSGVEIVYAAFWFVSGLLLYGGKVLEIDATKLLKLTESFLNDPDGDWSTVCDCGWFALWDMKTDIGDWDLITDASSSTQWVDGSGVNSPVTTQPELEMTFDWLTASDLISIRFTLSVTFTGPNPVFSVRNIDNQSDRVEVGAQTGTTFTVNLVGKNWTGVIIKAARNVGQPNTPFTMYVEEILLRGLGTKPAALP